MRLRARHATPRLRRTIAAIAAASLAAFGLALASAASPAVAATSSCSAAYSVQTDWGSGFTASLAVTNNGTAAITGWTVTYT
ncbi:MAG TPA: cellulose binding domain-containing protein, partial [Trebonia sp.]|nr:cellulose binding domain-containing protein [Trebonia sp.]